MRIWAAIVCGIVILAINNATIAGGVSSATATIQATARVVPPVGIDAVKDLEPLNAAPPGQFFWLHAPRPGAAYVTLADAAGQSVCIPSLTALSTLEQHRYRSLLCLEPGTTVSPNDQPYTLTVIYSAD